MHFLPFKFLRKDAQASLIDDLLKTIAREDARSDKDIFNVVVIGHTGVGTSSFINILLPTTTNGASARPHAPTISTDATPCTKSFTAYPLTLNNRTFRLIDAPGFGALKTSTTPHTPTTTTAAITKALRELDLQFGIDLVVHCLRGTRGPGDIHAGAHHYTLIRSAVAEDVPIVAVITGLERYGYGHGCDDARASMERWWSTNEADLKASRMVFADHVCITTLGAAADWEWHGRDRRRIHDGAHATTFKDRVLESEKLAKALVMRNCWAGKRGIGRWHQRGDMFE